MKFYNLLAPLILVLLLVSCQPELEDIIDPEPGTGSEKAKILLKETHYDQLGNPTHMDYRLYLEDTVARTITCMYDSLSDSYDRCYYDANGRLLKIVYNNWDESVPVSKDSLVFTKIDPNHISWKYSDDTYSNEAVTTPLPGGRKQIVITNTRQDPTQDYTRLLFDASGTLDSVIMRSSNGNGEYYKKEVLYAYGVPVSMINWWQQLPDGPVYRTTRNFTRDTRSNSYLLSFISKLAGSDLSWMKYDFDNAMTGFFDYQITDQLFLQGGTIQALTAATRQFNSNGTTIDTGPWVYEYPIQYDSRGRLTSWKEIIDSKLSTLIEMEYFD